MKTSERSGGTTAPGARQVLFTRPLVDAWIIALVVLGSFFLSATIVLWRGKMETRSLVPHLVESAAWRISREAGDNGTEPADIEDLRGTLKKILREQPAIRCLAVLRDAGQGWEVVVLEGESELLGEGSPHTPMGSPGAGDDLSGWRGSRTSMPGGEPVAYVPIGTGDSHMVRAEGRLAGLLPNDWPDLAPVTGIAVTVAVLLGFIVYTGSRRFHNAFGQLAHAEKRLRDVADSAGEYIWEVDANGHYTFLSERVRDVLGYAPGELLGRHPFDFVDREVSAEVRSRSDFLVRRAEAFRDFEHRMMRKDGRLIWLSVNGVPVLDAEGRLTGFRGAALDISEHKQYEQDLVREKEAAQAASVAKSQFLAMMSHEIRTPLNSVLGFADLLANSALEPAQRENLETIRTSATGLMALLNDILEFSRTEAGPVNKPQPTRIRDFLREVVALHMPVARGKGIDLRVEIEEAVPGWLAFDQACLRQILLNLVGNAVKFTGRGFVRVTVSKDPQAGEGAGFPLKIAVADSGVGILQETREQLFTPFSQEDSSPTRKFGGTGMGLAICRKLAGLMGGSVRLEDSSPHGSTFCFSGRFGEAGSDATSPTATCPLPGTAPRHLPLRVLVAEDNPASRKLMQIMLSKQGIAHEIAGDGQEALAKHTRQPFDLILMDIRMPVMDGISTARAIRDGEAAGRLPGRVVIVALTADAMDGDRRSCLQAGMDDYLSKPVNREMLAAVLAAHAAEKSGAEKSGAAETAGRTENFREDDRIA